LISSPVQALVVFDGHVDLDFVRAALPAGTSSQTIPLSQGVERVLVALDETAADLLIVGTADSSHGALELIGEARRRHENCVIVALHNASPNGFLQRAFHVGADDLVALPVSSESLTFVFEKAIARRRRATAATSPSPLICIVGPKGGTGKTLTACTLGVALADAGKRTALIDGDLQFGDVGLALGLAPQRTIYDLATSGGTIDAEKIGQHLTRHESGLDVLLAPTRPDEAGSIDPRLLRTIYSVLRATHDYVIVDTPPAFSSEVIATIDEASHILVVGMLDALSLKDTKIGFETLGLMGIDPGRMTLLLNRADTNVGISQADVETVLGRKPDVLVPSDRAIPRAITDATPIVTASPKSGAAQAFRSLADIYLEHSRLEAERTAGHGDQDPGQPRRTLLRRR
jgi:pilus assembly protein CpaE